MGLDNYRNRVLFKGNTSQERILHDMRDAYDHYLSISPEATTVTIDNREYKYLVQDRRFADEELGGKYMITPHDVQYEVGQYVKFKGLDWFVDLVEVETIERSNAHRLLDCNEVLKWQDKNGRIYEFPCYSTDKTSVYSDGLARSEKITTSIYQTQIIVPNNKHTSMIDTHDRFIFSNSKFHIYNVTRIDEISRKGLLVIVMKRDEMVREYDNLAENLSMPIGTNAILDHNRVRPDQDGEMDYVIPEIIGDNKISIWDSEVAYQIPNANLIEWDIDETLVIARVEEDTLYLTPRGQLGKVNIRANVDGNELAKEIQIVFTR